jgi:lysophospholipase L1-like esterase
LLQMGQARRRPTWSDLRTEASTNMTRRRHRCAAIVASVAWLAGCVASVASRGGDPWVGAWGFPATSFPQQLAAAGSSPAPAANAANAANAPPANFVNVTVRQIVRLSAPALRVRIRLSNEFGLTPMTLGAVHIAQLAEGGSIIPGSDHVVTFSGQRSVSIPAAAPMLSDPIEWRLPSLTRLAVSIFLPQETIPPAHRVSEYVSLSGNFAGAQQMPGAELLRSGALVSGIEIISDSAARVIVTFGDSITEGFGSTANEFHGWSDRLAERLTRSPATRGWSVVNAGINSNRLLHSNPGADALARFDRDVLSVPGVAAVIVLEGINDIGYSHTVPAEAVTAGEIIDAYAQIIARAHEHGIAVIGGTITPFEDSHYYEPQGEQVRQSVNRWIRTSGAFDGVVDFDSALRDAAHPSRLAPSLERGDHLHPNDAGYAAMAGAIDLHLFTSPPRRGQR